MNSIEDVKKTLLDYYEAFHNRDWDKFASFLTDDFRYFTDKATVMNRKNFVDFLGKDSWIGKDYRVFDVDITVSSAGDIAWGTYKTVFIGNFQEKEMTVSAIETSIFVKVNGDWKIAHHHTSNKA